MVRPRLFGAVKMTYTYRYIPAAIAATAKKGSAPKNDYVELFQETLKEQFYNASNWYTVEEETALGSNVFANVDVRIAHLINAETGLKLGDDWKTLLFQDVDHPIELGKFYKFDGSTWMTVNTEFVKNLTGTCTIRRCNNTLRWVDEGTGAYYEEPCAIEYLVKEPRDYATQGSPFMTPGGFLHIETQFNERTNKINENQRFMFGNTEHWTCYKVIGTGINDFRNLTTYDNQSAKILTLDLIANFVNNELDDIVNGIADVYTNVYTMALNKTNVSGSPTGSIELTASVTYNDKSVVRNITWTSSKEKYATVASTGSMTALVSLVATGSCIITGTIENNSTSASCIVTVQNTPTANNDVRITPDYNYILEGSSRTYGVYLYTNDVQQANTFTITCNGNSVPSTSYTFTQVDGNHFTVSNVLRDVSSYLTITCVSGTNTKTQTIYLKGAW